MPARAMMFAAIAATTIAFGPATIAAEGKTPMDSASHMQSDSEPDEALVAAVRNDDAMTVGALLAAYRAEGRPLPEHKNDGTLLHIAASYGAQAVARLLLEAGLSPRAVTAHGFTPLHHASRGDRPELVKLLLAAGADLEARTARGLTPLHVSNGTTQLLLDAGADPYATDEDGETAIFKAVTDVGALVRAGLDVNARNRHGWTPLHVAALYAQTDHARALLDHGAEIEARTSAEYVIVNRESWGTERRSIPAGYTALDIAYNEHDRVKWVTGRNASMINLLRQRGATRPFLGIRFLRW